MTEDIRDYVVIGAGPAGLQLAYMLEQAGRDYVVLEAGAGAGTFFRTYPRHRQLISNNKKHTGWTDPERNMRMDWNSLLSDDDKLLFTRYSDAFFPAADDFVRYLEDFAAGTGLRIAYDTTVVKVDRPEADGPFLITDQRGDTIRARRVIAATGVTRPYLPDVPGIELTEDYSEVSVNPAEFTDKRVLILGKGNSAFETADNLIANAAMIHVVGPHSVKLAWRTHFVGHLRGVNNGLLDLYQLKSQHAVLDGTVRQITRDADGRYLVTVAFTRADEVTKDIAYDRVITCTGFRFDTTVFAPGCRPATTINDRFPAQTNEWESTTVPGLFFAGTITQVRDFKKSASGFIHGYRYNSRALYHILARRFHGEEWPHQEINADPAGVTEAILDRANRSSALWQQFGFLCDVAALRPDGTARYYQEMPADLVRDVGIDGASEWFALTLEYGPDHDRVDPFDVTVARIGQDDAGRAFDSRYLHPVIRHFRDGEVVGEHHVAENLENDWTSPVVHQDPLRAFVAAAGTAGVA